MSFSLGEYQDIFLEEADELLQELNRNLLNLEKNKDDEEIINNIFRAAHSLKSSAAFVGLNDLSDLAHRMENLLQGIRDKTNTVTTEIVDVIFRCFDAISEIIELVASGVEPHQNLKPLVNEIDRVNESSKIADKPATEIQKGPVPAGTSAKPVKTSFNSSEAEMIKNLLAEGLKCYEILVEIEESAQMKWVKGQLITVNLEKNGDIVKVIPTIENMTTDESINTFKVIFLTGVSENQIYRDCDIDQIRNIYLKPIYTVESSGKTVLKIGQSIAIEKSEPVEEIVADNRDDEFTGVSDAQESPDDAPDPEEIDDAFDRRLSDQHVDHDRRKAPTLKTVKVSVDKLDLLLNNVGELVIANSGFYRLYEEIKKYTGKKSISNEFKNRMEQMSRIAKDLQAGIMKTRMVPIGQVFSRFNRLVRDLAREHNKNVELIIRGEETEIDKKVIDVIGEPLLHLIRNAVDHGIETTDERKRTGKQEVATVILNAYQGGNQIFVEISDDGRGIDINAIKEKVIEKKMATYEMLSTMDEMDIYNYIFIPGFSTARTITDISGRGVGMNVVKETVNELNGNVTIETEMGMGTRFILSFPLTLAIIPAIMVKVRREVYAIPLSDVIETIKISQSDIATVEGHEVINLRGEILSLLRLNEFVGLKSALSNSQKIPVVVVGYGSRKIGLIVDFLEGKMEIVIKSLEQNYTTVEGLAGASILGDGSICLILDIQTMINRVISEQDKLTHEERRRIMQARLIDTDDDFSAEEGSIFNQEEETRILLSDIRDIGKEKSAESLADIDAKPTFISDVFIFSDESETGAADSANAVSEKTEEKPAQESSEGDIESTGAVQTVGETEAEPEDEELRAKVKDMLSDFKEELKQNVSSVVMAGDSDSHMASELNITKEEINEFNLLSNMGAANAAESLSKILNKRVDLSIPEVRLAPVEKIPESMGGLNEPYMGVMLGIEGEINGTMLLMLQEKTGLQLIDMLYGYEIGSAKELSEDGVSALKEMTNIIGSSILNVYAEKSNMVVRPDVPTFVHDFLQSVIDSILVMHNIEHDYAIVMETAFYFENDQIMGNLLILPETESLKVLIKGFKSNVKD